MADENKPKHQGWVASLSNGETVFEAPASEQVAGERLPWGQLFERCMEEGLWVTQLQLQLHGRTIVGIKNADGYCYFIDYRADGWLGAGNSGPANETRHNGLGSVVGNTVYCTLVDEQGQSWQDSRPLSVMRLHCVLKPAEPTG